MRVRKTEQLNQCVYVCVWHTLCVYMFFSEWKYYRHIMLKYFAEVNVQNDCFAQVTTNPSRSILIRVSTPWAFYKTLFTMNNAWINKRMLTKKSSTSMLFIWLLTSIQLFSYYNIVDFLFKKSTLYSDCTTSDFIYKHWLWPNNRGGFSFTLLMRNTHIHIV